MTLRDKIVTIVAVSILLAGAMKQPVARWNMLRVRAEITSSKYTGINTDWSWQEPPRADPKDPVYQALSGFIDRSNAEVKAQKKVDLVKAGEMLIERFNKEIVPVCLKSRIFVRTCTTLGQMNANCVPISQYLQDRGFVLRMAFTMIEEQGKRCPTQTPFIDLGVVAKTKVGTIKRFDGEESDFIIDYVVRGKHIWLGGIGKATIVGLTGRICIFEDILAPQVKDITTICDLYTHKPIKTTSLVSKQWLKSYKSLSLPAFKAKVLDDLVNLEEVHSLQWVADKEMVEKSQDRRLELEARLKLLTVLEERSMLNEMVSGRASSAAYYRVVGMAFSPGNTESHAAKAVISDLRSFSDDSEEAIVDLAKYRYLAKDASDQAYRLFLKCLDEPDPIAATIRMSRMKH